MALSAPTNATLGAQSTATGTISDETMDLSAFEKGLEGLPDGLKGGGEATVRACQALESLDPPELTEGQRNMLTSCEAVAEAAAENPDQTRDAVEQLSGQQNISRLPIAFAFGTTQLTNVNTRLLELRHGATGVSTTGLKSPGSGAPPLSAIASLGEILLGEGGGSGDAEGELLNERLGVFVNGAVRFGDKDQTSRETGFSFDTQGLTAGVDYRFSDSLVGGAAIGYGKASADFDHNHGSQDADNYAGSLYATWYSDQGYLDGIVGFGKVAYDTVRNLDLYDGSVVDTIKGDTDGDQWTAGLSAGYEWLKGGARLGPDFSLSYVRVEVDAFQETDQGSGLALKFGSQDGESLVLRAGGHLFYSLSQTWAVLSPYARFNVVKEFLNDPDKISIRYANDPIVIGQGSVGGDFVLLTDEPDEYYFEWAVGLTTDFKGGLSAFVDYESIEGLNAVSMGLVTIGLRYQKSFK